VVVARCQKYRGFSPWLIGQWKITCSSWAQDSIPYNVLQVPEKNLALNTFFKCGYEPKTKFFTGLVWGKSYPLVIEHSY
jgi:hypothetical protein